MLNCNRIHNYLSQSCPSAIGLKPRDTIVATLLLSTSSGMPKKSKSCQNCTHQILIYVRDAILMREDGIRRMEITQNLLAADR
jgi:hypothetical protein